MHVVLENDSILAPSFFCSHFVSFMSYVSGSYLGSDCSNRESQVERLKSQIFILRCTQRRSASLSPAFCFDSLPSFIWLGTQFSVWYLRRISLGHNLMFAS